MAGRLLGTILIISFLTYMVLLSSFYFMHQSIINNINSVNYNVCELVSTSGVFSQQAFSYLRENLGKFGDYEIKVKFEKQLTPGIYDTYFFDREELGKQADKEELEKLIRKDPSYVALINRKLKIGDRITVYVEDRDLTFFGKLINASFLGYQNDRFINTRIKSVKSCVIAKDAKDIVKGYDVMAEIKNRKSDLDNKMLEIHVVTKLRAVSSMEAYIYNDINDTYGEKEESEQNVNGNPGENYILYDGDFVRTEEGEEDETLSILEATPSEGSPTPAPFKTIIKFVQQ